MINDLKDYFSGYKSWENITDDNPVKAVAFVFLILVWFPFCAVRAVTLFITAPIWIIPYIIYDNKKRRRK